MIITDSYALLHDVVVAAIAEMRSTIPEKCMEDEAAWRRLYWQGQLAEKLEKVLSALRESA